MCNFSQGFIERGREEGIEIGVEKGIGIGRKEGIEIGVEKGIKIGREKERKQSQIESLKAVMESLNVDFTKAADILKIPEAEREYYRKLLP